MDRVVEREYPDGEAFKRDARRMRAQGYEAIDAVERRHRRSLRRVLTLGIGALVTRRTRIIASYRPVQEHEGGRG